MMKSIGKKEKQERRKKIQESKYNKTYRKMMTKEISEYVYKRKKRQDRRLIIRYRYRNEMRRCQHRRQRKEMQNMRRLSREYNTCAKRMRSNNNEMQIEEF